MIRLFVTDLDGCLSHPFQAPDWTALAALVALHDRAGQDPHIPPLTICTGRPLAYAEAIAQWLSVTAPVVFESGSGLYDPVTNQVAWTPAIDAVTDRALAELRGFVHGELVAAHPGTLAEFGKHKDVGVIHRDAATILTMRALIEEKVARYPEAALEVHHTEISVSVIPRAANKGAGLRWLADRLGLIPAELAYIGDSQGDLPALALAGAAFAPANAVPEVRAVARVTTGEATAGVLEAYRAVIATNRAHSASAPDLPGAPEQS
ncbi:HAD hydrolase family protein [Haliangium sp.]|uniref:HAD hydrolase family protein n=1 Tax=Haliangium sp. TaxID=2663208 RepID=UPI003D1512AD